MADNYESRKRQLERRRKLTEALMSQGMEQPKGQMIGPHYLAPNPLSALMPAVTAFAGMKASEGLDKEESALSAEKQKAMADALQSIMSQRSHGGDWMGAALSSPHPEVQAMGMKGFESDLKPEKFKIEKMRDPGTGKLVNVRVGDRGTTKRMDEFEPATKVNTVYGKAYDPYNTEPGTQVATPPDRSINISNTTYLPDAEKNLNKKVGTLVGERTVDQLLQQRQAVVKDWETASHLQKLAGQEMTTGRLAPIGVFLAQLGSSMGMVPNEGLTNAERYDASVERAVSDMIMTDPKGITAEEGKRFAKSWAPLVSSAEGRMKIIQDIKDLRRKQFNRIEAATENLKERNPGLYDMIQIDPAMQMAIPEQEELAAPSLIPPVQGRGPQPIVPQPAVSKPIFRGWKQ